jgi:hypothetical protein
VSPYATRHLPWLVALLTLATVAVTLASLRAARWDDCANPEAIQDIGRLLEGTPGEFQRFYHSHVFLRQEGTLPPVPGLRNLHYRVVRTDEARRPFDWPTRFLRVAMDPEHRRVRWIESDGGRFPVHLMYAHHVSAIRVVASVYVYDGQPVDSLLPLQIGSAVRQLQAGRRPLTLLQVHIAGPPSREQEIEERALSWLTSAWSLYRGLCEL